MYRTISDVCWQVLKTFREALYCEIGDQKPRESKDICYLVVIS